MKEKISTFQIILFVALGFAIIIGVMIFSFQRSTSTQQTGPVTMWGTLPSDVIRELTDKINEVKQDTINLNYVEFTALEFEQKLIEALAAGAGPDVVVFNDDLLVRHENKLSPIAYEFYPQKTFKDTFIEAGDVLLKTDSVSGLPWIVDPMVMYYNRSILNTEGIALPPKYWDEFLTLVPRLVRSNSSFNIQRAALSLGEFRNVKYAKEIFATLVMQAGNPIFQRNYVPTDSFERTEFISTFADRLGFPVVPAEAALTYFTQFSNPTKTSYTWNRALPNSEEMFLAGDLVFYFGLASEYKNLQRKNPNLNFDVAMMPQSRSSNQNITYADLYFIGFIKNSPNLQNAFNAAYTLTSPENIGNLSSIMNLPPVRRDLLVHKNDNAALQTFYSSALIAKPFVDPNVQETSRIWTDMVESVISGRSNETDAVIRADAEIEKYLK